MSTTVDERPEVDKLAPEDRALWDALGPAKPRFTHWPTPGAPHELHACAAVAAALGTPLTPPQRWKVRVITERRAADPSRYRFRRFLVTEPRQVGKTTTVRVILLTRAIVNKHRRAWYTAQTGKDATQRFTDLANAVTATDPPSPFAPWVHHRKAAGSAALSVIPTGSFLSPFTPSAESLHGYTLDDVALDECFAFTMDEGVNLLGAVVPAQQTIPGAQCLMLSTAGDRTSVWLRAEVDKGRAATADPASRFGYMEWSLAPGLDPMDLANIEFHPGLGYTVTLEELADALADLPRGVWLRAYCNLWTEDADPLLDMIRWDELGGTLAPVPLSATSVGFGVHPERNRAAAVAAWRPPDQLGRIAVKLLHSSADVGRFGAYLADLQRSDPRPSVLIADDYGLTASVIDQLRQELPEHLHPRTTNPKEWQLASAALHSAIEDGVILHGAEPVLTGGVAGALARPVLQSWALSHESPPEVMALAAALRGLVKPSEPSPLLVV